MRLPASLPKQKSRALGEIISRRRPLRCTGIQKRRENLKYPANSLFTSRLQACISHQTSRIYPQSYGTLTLNTCKVANDADIDINKSGGINVAYALVIEGARANVYRLWSLHTLRTCIRVQIHSVVMQRGGATQRITLSAARRHRHAAVSHTRERA